MNWDLGLFEGPGRGQPELQWATATTVGPGAVREAGGRPSDLQWATAAAVVGPGAVRVAWGI